jgi:hypothetical protein
MPIHCNGKSRPFPSLHTVDISGRLGIRTMSAQIEKIRRESDEITYRSKHTPTIFEISEQKATD